MEDELIDQQKQCEQRTPNENIHFWYEKFSSDYKKLCETYSPTEAFGKLIPIKNEIEQRLEKAKNSLDNFSKQLSSILIDEDTLDKSSDLYQIHHNILLNAQLTFTSQTIGNFMYGRMNLNKSKKELARIKKDFPEHLDSLTDLYHMVKEYIRETKQKGKRSIVSKIPKAFEIRFIADKLHYQKIALTILLDHVFLYDYPSKIPALKITERNRLNNFLYENQKKSKHTSNELYKDIYFLIKRNENSGEKYLFNNGKLVYSALSVIALDTEGEEKEFAQKWNSKKNKKNGVSKTWLEKKIKEIYEEVILP